MATATFTGVTRLKTEGMRIGFQRQKHDLRQFKREVAQPFAEAGGAMAALVKRSALAGTALAVLGTRQVFKLEGVEEQFTVLMGSTEKAKKRIGELMDLAAKTPFGMNAYVEAARMLYAVGGDKLSGDDMLTKLGDTAASMGVDMQQAAIWTAKLYNSMKSGSGVGTSGDDMMRAGLLRGETYVRLKEMGDDVRNFDKVWALVQGDMSRFNGGMERLARTGSGMVNKFTDLLSIGSIQLFKGFAESVKDALNQISQALENGGMEKLKQWGQSLGNLARQVLDFAARMSAAWQNLDDNSRKNLKSILAVGGVFVVGVKTGIIGPLTMGIGGLVKLLVNNFGLILKSASVFLVAFAGFKIGKALYDSLSPNGKNFTQGIALGFAHLFEQILVRFKGGCELVVDMAKLVGLRIKDALGFDGIDTAEMSAGIDKAIEKQTQVLNDLTARQDKTLSDFKTAIKTGVGEEKQEPFLDALEARFKETKSDIAALGESLADSLTPDSLREFMRTAGKLKNIKFPEAPKNGDLNRDVENSEKIVRNLKSATNVMRGYAFRTFGASIEARLAAARNSARQNATPAKTDTEKNTREALGDTNNILDRIERNTRNSSRAVYS